MMRRGRTGRRPARSSAEAGGLCGFLLKLTYSLGYVEIIDVLAVHLQKSVRGRFPRYAPAGKPAHDDPAK